MILSDAQRAVAAQALADALSDQYGMAFVPVVKDRSPRTSSSAQRQAPTDASSPPPRVGE